MIYPIYVYGMPVLRKVAQDIDKDYVVTFTWHLATPEISAAWLLGQAGDSELGETTFLGR